MAAEIPITPVATSETLSRGGDERCLWMPPSRMRRYQWSKVVGGALMASTFVGWLVLQWSSPMVRFLALALIGVTAWVVAHSWVVDARRARGRQIEVDRCGSAGVRIKISRPGHCEEVALDRVVRARWCASFDFDEAGLWLYDAGGRVLAHVDRAFLDDEAEARAFLGWLRRRWGGMIRVSWGAGASGAGDP